MGFGFGKKKDDKSTSKEDEKKGFSIGNGASSHAAETTTTSPAQASSVFEFGTVVQVGQDFMRGVCIGEDPDAIQACTWSVETAAKAKDKQHLYRIEF